jgi:hypothetical protein
LNQPNALVPRSKQWLRGRATWSQQSQRWTFPSGATITFGYLDRPDDVYQYQGAEFQFVGFDELTQFREEEYTYLASRLRRLQSSSVPVRIYSASNPGGRGHQWVRARFIDPATRREGCEFIPATLSDNLFLDRAEYAEMLEKLDPITRSQLLLGDWEVGEDGLLKWDWITACETVDLPPTQQRPEKYVGVDVGRTRDRSVIWTWEKVGDVYHAREIKVLDKCPFDQQFVEISRRITPDVVACAIDKGFNPQLAEDLVRRYPRQVSGVQLTQGQQGLLAAQLANAFERRQVRIPINNDLRADLQLVKRVDIRSGGIVVETDRDRTGHADRFWAGALGYDCAYRRYRRPEVKASLPGFVGRK